MQKLKLILLSVVITLLMPDFLLAQEVIVYKTYEDLIQKSGDTYDEFVKKFFSGQKVRITLLKNGKKVKVPCKDIWGFTYKDALFRTDPELGSPVRVISMGDICYYENGWSHLSMLQYDTDSGSSQIGYKCGISKDLTSEIVRFPTIAGEKRKRIMAFEKKNPIAKPLFKCISSNYNIDVIRECVYEFQEEEEEED